MPIQGTDQPIAPRPTLNQIMTTTSSKPQCKFWMLGFGALILAPIACATLPEPDNLLYGTIVLDNLPVTAARTDVVVEARRLTNGPAIASYRIGSNPRVGNFYLLRLAMESVPPASASEVSQVGDSLFIMVSDVSGLRRQSTFTFTERGRAQRLDFGAAVTDSDNNGLPDLWELSRFGVTGQNPSAVNLNGQTTLQNYIAGTDPNDPTSVFKLGVTANNGQVAVSFLALRAQGPGYDGATRFYSLESDTNVGGGQWLGVSNFTNLQGADQILIFSTPGTQPKSFYRGSVRLQVP